MPAHSKPVHPNLVKLLQEYLKMAKAIEDESTSFCLRCLDDPNYGIDAEHMHHAIECTVHCDDPQCPLYDGKKGHRTQRFGCSTGIKFSTEHERRLKLHGSNFNGLGFFYNHETKKFHQKGNVMLPLPIRKKFQELNSFFEACMGVFGGKIDKLSLRVPPKLTSEIWMELVSDDNGQCVVSGCTPGRKEGPHHVSTRGCVTGRICGLLCELEKSSETVCRPPTVVMHTTRATPQGSPSSSAWANSQGQNVSPQAKPNSDASVPPQAKPNSDASVPPQAKQNSEASRQEAELLSLKESLKNKDEEIERLRASQRENDALLREKDDVIQRTLMDVHEYQATIHGLQESLREKDAVFKKMDDELRNTKDELVKVMRILVEERRPLPSPPMRTHNPYGNSPPKGQ